MSFDSSAAQAQNTQSEVPEGYLALYQQATNECGTGNWAAARDLFAQAHELLPNAHTLRGLGLTELKLGNYERAQDFLARALQSTVRPLSAALRPQTEQLLAEARSHLAPVAVAPPIVTPPPAPPTPPPVNAPPVYAPPVDAPPVTAPQTLPVTSEPEPQFPEASRSDEAKTHYAASLSAAAIVPLYGFAEKTRGMGLNAGLWVQQAHLVEELRMGLLFSIDQENKGYVHYVPIEVGTYVFAPVDNHAFFVGPGVSLNAIFERTDVAHTVGDVIMASSHGTYHTRTFAFGVYGRMGVVLFRTKVASLVPSVDYAINFADFRYKSYEHAVRINIGVLLGGGR